MAFPSERSATNFLSLTSFSSSCLSRLTFDDPRPPYFSSFVKRSIRYLHVQHSPRFCRSYCVAITSWIQGRLLKLGRLVFVVPARRLKWELLANSIKDDRLVERKYAASSLIAIKSPHRAGFLFEGYGSPTDFILFRRTLFSFYIEKPILGASFHRHGLGQVTRLVHVGATSNRRMIGQQLQRHYMKNGG